MVVVITEAALLFLAATTTHSISTSTSTTLISTSSMSSTSTSISSNHSPAGRPAFTWASATASNACGRCQQAR